MPKSDDPLHTVIEILKPATLAMLDCVCVVNLKAEVVFFNTAFKNFTRLSSARDIGKGKKFCDLMKLAVCSDSCQIEAAIHAGTVLKLDETPAACAKHKYRLSLRCANLKFDGKPVGALIMVRDTTAEILLQAKYKRMQEMIEEKDHEIVEMKEKIRSLRNANFHSTNKS